MLKSKYDKGSNTLVIYEDEMKFYEFNFHNCNRDYNRIDTILSHLISIKKSVGTFVFKIGYLSMNNSYISLLLFNDSHTIGYSLFKTNYFYGESELIANNIFTENDYEELSNPIYEFWKYFKEREVICYE